MILKGQTAVITGASGGVGKATAQRLATSGARVIGIARHNTNDLQTYLDQLPNHDLGHQAIQADVTCSQELELATQHISRCDILVTSAGFSRTISHADLDSLTDEFFDDILTANLRSVFSTIRVFVNRLQQSPAGLIVNISSASAIRSGHGSNLAYAAAKAGVESITKNLALCLAPCVRVVSVAPSLLATGFLNHTQQVYDRVAAATPLQRLGTAEDVADTVEAIATRMKFVTGNCFVVDGGRTL
jgi:3-oxoacyl-[acyl-carrier protein] reductase